MGLAIDRGQQHAAERRPQLRRIPHPAGAAIALELADAGAFQLAAGGGWGPAADVDGDSRITSPGRSHDPASRNRRDRIVTTTVYDPDRWYAVFECGASALPPTFL